MIYVLLLVWGLTGWALALALGARRLTDLQVQDSRPPAIEEATSTQDAPPPARRKPDPGAQALAILRRGENCDWYSIKHSDEMHEAFDCLEIYWRTNVEHPERNEFRYGRGPFELKAGFRVRWHVAATHHSHVEACGLDLMTTILEARALADRLAERAHLAWSRSNPALEAWKARAPGRKYSFHGLDIDEWRVTLEFPGGYVWGASADLDQAVADALSKGPA